MLKVSLRIPLKIKVRVALGRTPVLILGPPIIVTRHFQSSIRLELEATTGSEDSGPAPDCVDSSVCGS